MHIGVSFPQTEIGDDPAAIRDWAQAAEAFGFGHIAIYDHVVGADLADRPDWPHAVSVATPFHEPFVLGGYLAAATRRIELLTALVILPQRQAVLVAKQAAEVELLSGGRLRLGVGVGKIALEFEALGEDFRTRGARMEEQIAVLRALWSARSVAFAGRWHRIDAAGINPRPARPIPLWIGGGVEATLRRAAHLGDGWLLPGRFWGGPPGDDARAMIVRLGRYAAEVGRSPGAVGVQAGLTVGDGPWDDLPDRVAAWGAAGATHLFLDTMNAGLAGARLQIEALRRLATVIGLRPGGAAKGEEAG